MCMHGTSPALGLSLNPLRLVTQPEAQRRQCPTLVYFHGNAGNIGYRLVNVRDIYYNTGANILVVEYRGWERLQCSDQ